MEFTQEELVAKHCRGIFRDGMNVYSEDALTRVMEVSRLKSYKRGEILLEAGQLMKDCAFIVSGSFCHFVRDSEGRETVICIAGDYGDPSIPFSTLEEFMKPSPVYVEASEHLTVLLVPTQFMIGFIMEEPERMAAMASIVGKWNVIHSKMAINNTYNIAERYNAYKDLFPDLFARIPQGTAARFLNVSPAALSRALKPNKKST